MRRTRLGVGVLSAVMLVSGAAMALAGRGWFDISGGDPGSGDAVARTLGIALVALGVLFAQIARHRAEALYATVGALAGAASAALVAISLASSDPFSPAPGVVVGGGALLTAYGLWLDRRPRAFGKVGRRMDSMEMR